MAACVLNEENKDLMYRIVLHRSINILDLDLYNTARNAFDVGNSIMRASERGLGPGNRDFLCPVK